jgi:hypothetical protein
MKLVTDPAPDQTGKVASGAPNVASRSSVLTETRLTTAPEMT